MQSSWGNDLNQDTLRNQINNVKFIKDKKLFIKSKMRIYDISREISEDMVIYKNRKEKAPKIGITRTLKEGANESKLDIHVHTGTHVDAPYHVLDNGKRIDELNPDKFMGKCVVLDFTKEKNSITENSLTKIKNSKLKINKDDIVLLKTKNQPE